jgi:hypothetical protein
MASVAQTTTRPKKRDVSSAAKIRAGAKDLRGAAALLVAEEPGLVATDLPRIKGQALAAIAEHAFNAPARGLTYAGEVEDLHLYLSDCATQDFDMIDGDMRLLAVAGAWLASRYHPEGSPIDRGVLEAVRALASLFVIWDADTVHDLCQPKAGHFDANGEPVPEGAS